jgi:UDP-N-acetylmuramate dehydrogenase
VLSERRAQNVPNAAREALEALPACEVRRAVSLARHTSLGVGGPADILAIPENRKSAGRVLDICREHELPVLVLGKGFNTLVRDGGFRGVVLALWRLRRLELTEEGELLAEAGVSHGRVAHYCGENGLSGLEFAAGIPGTVGGWIAMNAGIPDREMGDVLSQVQILGERGEEARDAASMGFRYRGSDLSEGTAVLAGRFRVSSDAPEAVRKRVAAHLEARVRSQPIHRASCGSVFKNPPGDYAGRLIEEAELKGRECGAAAFSELHANFIVTRRGARAADVLALIERARAAVYERSGVTLETEVHIVGEDE